MVSAREESGEFECHVTCHCFWYGTIEKSWGNPGNRQQHDISKQLTIGRYPRATNGILQLPGDLRSLLLRGITLAGHSQFQTGLLEELYSFFLSLVKVSMTICLMVWNKFCLSYHIFWENYNDLTATLLESLINRGNHAQMALILLSKLL